MTKSSHSPEYQHIMNRLRSMRKEAGLTQRQLADKLGREQSFVWRIESGERRLDLLEFNWVCKALGASSEQVYADLVYLFEQSEDKMDYHLKVAEEPEHYGD